MFQRNTKNPETKMNINMKMKMNKMTKMTNYLILMMMVNKIKQKENNHIIKNTEFWLKDTFTRLVYDTK